MTEPTACCSVGSQANFAEEDGIVDRELATPRLPSYKGFYYLRINIPYSLYLAPEGLIHFRTF